MSASRGESGESPEEALRASEERLRLALEAGRMGTWEWHVATNRVTWSPALEAIHGLAPGTFAGTFEAYQEDIHPDDRAHVLRAIEATLKDGTDHKLQYRIVRSDGSVRWVEGRGRLFRGEDGKPLRMSGVCTDVTDRRLAETAALASEKRYQRLLALMPAAVYTCEAPSGAITFFNEKAASIWGRSPALGDLDERFCGSLRLWNADGTPLPHEQTPMALALREGREFRNCEVVIERPDGTRIPVMVNIDPMRDAEGRLIGAINVFHDTAERNRAEEMQARLAAIVESSDDAILGLNRDGVITSWNRGAERLYGYRAGEVVGNPVSLLIPPDHENDFPSILQRLRTGERIEHYETVRVARDGRRIDVSLTVSPIRDAAGNLVGASKIARDISERKRVEDTLREADRRKDEFIAMLSHELRNPLAPIRSALELLRMKNAGMEPAQIYDIIERQVSHLVRLVDDLLEISRVERGLVELRREPLRLNDVLHSAIETSTPLLDAAGHLLEVDVPSEPLWVHGDRVRLAQVFANLLNNAARFTARGGRISVAVRRTNGSVAIAVRDTGIGFSAHARERLFEMFSRGEQSSGLGIGLALARRLVEMHDGRIEAQSAGEGQGAEFVVRLPLADAVAGHAHASAAPQAAEEEAPRYRVLVADDNRDAAESLGMLLRMLGNDVMLAFDGEEAVALARGFKPQVALLDVGMPKLDGYGAAREIRRAAGEVRLVALTGWGQESDRRRAREAGFDAHLVKPADLEMLRAAIAGPAQERSS